MVTKNENPVVSKKIKRKKSKYTTKESQQTMAEESQRKKNQRRTTKTTVKQVTKMAISTYLSIIPFEYKYTNCSNKKT